jgi:signal peptidase I
VSRLLHWRALANLALQLAILALLAAAFFVRLPQVWGPSMAPHIASGEHVLVNTFAYRFAGPKRGDIVAFRRDDAMRPLFIKRVIGLPGDCIDIRRGRVLVDGRPLAEPYVRYPDERSFPQTTVPDGTVYVLGDNRADSEDSRFFGPIPQSQLLGRALAVIWPPSELGTL